VDISLPDKQLSPAEGFARSSETGTGRELTASRGLGSFVFPAHQEKSKGKVEGNEVRCFRNSGKVNCRYFVAG